MPGIVLSDHDPAPEQGPEGFKEMFRTMRSAFPDLEVTPEHMIATGDDVALAYTIAGTHEGEFLGVAPHRTEDNGPRRPDRALRGRQARRALGLL